MKSQLKKARVMFYQKVYGWALNKWRQELGDTRLKRPTGKISNHALMRYAERFDDYDFVAAEKTILNDKVIEKIKDLGGDGKFSIDGIFYVVKSGKVITVAKAEGIKSHLTYAPTNPNSNRGRRWTF